MIQTFTPSSVGRGPAGPPGGQPQAKDLGLGGTGCSGGGGPAYPVCPALVAAARTDAGSLAMLTHSPTLLRSGRAGTWERCHRPDHARVREVTKPQRSRGTCPGLPLPRQTPRCYRTAPFLTAPWPAAPLCPPLVLRGVQIPPLTRVFLAFLQVWLQIALQASQPAGCLGAKNGVTRLDFGWVSREGTFPTPPMCHGCPPLSKKHSTNPSGNLLYGLGQNPMHWLFKKH